MPGLQSGGVALDPGQDLGLEFVVDALGAALRVDKPIPLDYRSSALRTFRDVAAARLPVPACRVAVRAQRGHEAPGFATRLLLSCVPSQPGDCSGEIVGHFSSWLSSPVNRLSELDRKLMPRWQATHAGCPLRCSQASCRVPKLAPAPLTCAFLNQQVIFMPPARTRGSARRGSCGVVSAPPRDD